MSKKTLKKVITPFLSGLFLSGIITEIILMSSFMSIEVYGLHNDLENFVDGEILNKHWAKEHIQYLLDKGAIAGYGDGKFYPDRKITRAEFVVMLDRLLDPTGAEIEKQFKKNSGKEYEEIKNKLLNYSNTILKDATWQKESILKSHYLYLVSNFNHLYIKELANADFLTINDWNKTITKEESIEILDNFVNNFGLKDLGFTLCNTSIIDDIENNINDFNKYYYSESEKVKWGDILEAYSLGIIALDNEGNINPKSTLTRAETCSILHRVMEPSERFIVKIDNYKEDDKYIIENNKIISQINKIRKGIKYTDVFTSMNTIARIYNNECTRSSNEICKLNSIKINRYCSNQTEGRNLVQNLLNYSDCYSNWKTELKMILGLGWEKPTYKGKKDGERSNQGIYYWDEDLQKWIIDNRLKVELK